MVSIRYKQKCSRRFRISRAISTIHFRYPERSFIRIFFYSAVSLRHNVYLPFCISVTTTRYFFYKISRRRRRYGFASDEDLVVEEAEEEKEERRERGVKLQESGANKSDSVLSCCTIYLYWALETNNIPLGTLKRIIFTRVFIRIIMMIFFFCK